MNNQSIIEAMTQKGFDFNQSSLQAKTLAIEKFRQYGETAGKYLLEAGIPNLQPFVSGIQDIALETAFEYVQFYDQLLHKSRPDETIPLDAVQVNLNDLFCYGEVIAGSFHNRLAAILGEQGLQSRYESDSAYLDKLFKGYTVSDEE